MSESGPPPRGRGALLLKFIKEKQGSQQEASTSSSNVPESTATVTRGGRGRAMAVAKLLEKASQAASSSESGIPSPRGVGRASSAAKLIEKLQQTKISPSPEVKEPPTPIRQETAPVIKRAVPGKSDQVVPSTANYIRLLLEPGKGVFEYEVRFYPPVDAKGIKFKLLNQFIQGARTFDGVTLYLPEQLKETVNIFQGEHPIDQSPVEVKVIFKRKKFLGECIHLYNVLFRRIFKILHYAQIGRQNFDPSKPYRINQHKLEIWPGYITSIDEFEGGIMLCIDCSHRVLRTDTVRAYLANALQHKNPRTFQQDATKALVGTSVLTKYNNKLYRIDDIMWDLTPRGTFTAANNTEISYYEYYEKQYGIRIQDLDQPMLVHRAKRRLPQSSEKVDQLICLVPELCYMTGLTDEMRSNFQLMKDVSTYTRITPNQRIQALKKFVENVQKSDEARKLLASWGLKLADCTIDLEMRVLAPEVIVFGNADVPGTPQADWTRAVTSNHVISAIDLHKWYLIHTAQDRRNAEQFKQTMLQIGGPMGIRIAPPMTYILQNDNNATYVEAFNKLIQPDIQILVIICPTSRDDRYSVIKKICCADKPIPSQVIISKTLGNPKKLRTVVQKVALQMNCKLGGQLWSVKLPKHRWMICGIDTYHDPQKVTGLSIAGFVASVNQKITRWYSQVSNQHKGEELHKALRAMFLSALKRYFEINGDWPSVIIIFRDGVGDGQLNVCKEYEIAQLQEAMQALCLSPENMPKLIFIVVQKRINTRLFLSQNEYDNPPAGSVMDHTITRRDWYDFFLVSQHVRQGTVTPSHYVVIHDDSQLSVDHVQKITYKMCHLYYNWSGTIRVPAPCQYAHKLAYLVGQNIRKTPSDKLSDLLYFL